MLPSNTSGNWLTLGSMVLSKRRVISEAAFKLNFKLNTKLTEIIWRRLNATGGNQNLNPKHLLWTLYLLKTSNPNHQQVAMALHTSYKTMKKHCCKTIKLLDQSLPNVWKIHTIEDQFMQFLLIVPIFKPIPKLAIH